MRASYLRQFGPCPAEHEFACALTRYANTHDADERGRIAADAAAALYRDAWNIAFDYMRAMNCGDPDAATYYADALDEEMDDLRFLWACDLAEQAIVAKLADGANLAEAIWENVAESEAKHGPRRSLQ